jgi:hypothetical protein
MVPRATKRHVLGIAKKIALFDPSKARIEAAEKRKQARLHIYEAQALLLRSHHGDLEPVSDLIDELTSVRNRLDVVSRLPDSGGQVFLWKRKLYTAGSCWYLIKRYGDAEPTTHRIWFRKYIQFSETMFAIATGDRENLSKACREWTRQQDNMAAIARRAGITSPSGRIIIIRKDN